MSCSHDRGIFFNSRACAAAFESNDIDIGHSKGVEPVLHSTNRPKRRAAAFATAAAAVLTPTRKSNVAQHPRNLTVQAVPHLSAPPSYRRLRRLEAMRCRVRSSPVVTPALL